MCFTETNKHQSIYSCAALPRRDNWPPKSFLLVSLEEHVAAPVSHQPPLELAGALTAGLTALNP